jgi:CRISPR system Cascade subunit CasE
MSFYLSRLVLNPASARARADLRNRYELHRTLSRGFGENVECYREARCLFRLDEMPPPPRVLVQSRIAPDWSRLEDAYLAREPEVKKLNLQLRGEQQLRFLLLANPTRREPARNAVDAATGRPKDGPRRALVFDDPAETVAACRGWLARKGEGGGFCPVRFEVEDRGVVTVAKGGKPVPFAAIQFEGLLQVTDPAVFLETLSEGIGSGKGYGFGLLSLAPARCGGQ